jgi:Glycerol-3-phosphate dehydrogenase
VAAGGRHVGVRCAGPVPQCADAPHAGQARPAGSGADAAGRGLLGGARFYDAQCDDARLTLATIRSAGHHGALVANYTAVRALERTAGRVVGAQLEDRLTGRRPRSGPAWWSTPAAPGPTGCGCWRTRGPTPLLQPTKGIHIVVDRSRLDHRDAIVFTSPIDGRVLFILPWNDLSYIGTTDTDTTEAPDALTVSTDDIVYLLRSANARFPNARLGVEDVRATGPASGRSWPTRSGGRNRGGRASTPSCTDRAA